MKIKSQLGDKKMRTLEIPDAEGLSFDDPLDNATFVKEIEREESKEIKRIKEAPKMPEISKNRLNTLLGLMRHEKVVEVSDFSFKIKLLNTSEQANILKSVYLNEKPTLMVFEAHETRKHTLATIIIEINGQKFNDLIIEYIKENGGQVSKEQIFQSKLDFIDNMDEFIAQGLMTRYLNFVTEKEAALKLKAPVEEIVEDIKKA
jgi:hypothetical protein